MTYLGFTDYMLIAAYMLACIAIGVYFTRRASRNLDEYYLGGKRMPWWLLGFSGMSSWFDITGTMVITSFIFMMGPRGILVELRGGTGFVLAFMLVFMGKWHRRSNCMTKAEWMIYRFGPGFWSEFTRFLTAIGQVLIVIGLMGYLIRGTGQFLAMFMPFSPSACSLLLILVSTFYTAIAGFYGVVYTEFFQSVLILTGAIAVGVVAFLAIPDLATLSSVATQVTAQPDWAGFSAPRHVPMPPGYEDFSPLLFIAFFYFARQFLGGFDTGADPKYFGARNERECGILSYLWQWLIMWRWVMLTGFAVLGIFLVRDWFPDQAVLAQVAELVKQHYPELTKNIWQDQLALISRAGADITPDLIAQLQNLLGAEWPTRIKLVSFEGGINPEQILPAVMLHSLPRGLRGFLFITMLAAGMSTFTAFANLAGPYFVKDIYQRHMRKRAANRELILISWLTTAAIMSGGYYLAYKAENINKIWDWLMMSLTVATGFPALLRFYWWRFSSAAVACSSVVGIIVVTVQYLFFKDMLGWQQFVLLFSATVGSSIFFSFIFPPAEDNVLRNFYRTTRPFGLWGRFKAELPPEQRSQVQREHRNDLIALPFAIVWQHSMYIVLMLLVMHNFKLAAIALVCYVIAEVALHYTWRRNLPPADEPLPQTQEMETSAQKSATVVV